MFAGKRFTQQVKVITVDQMRFLHQLLDSHKLCPFDRAVCAYLLVFMMQWQIMEKRAATWRSAQAYIRQDVLLRRRQCSFQFSFLPKGSQEQFGCIMRPKPSMQLG